MFSLYLGPYKINKFYETPLLFASFHIAALSFSKLEEKYEAIMRSCFCVYQKLCSYSINKKW
jgi:hypothetical protein